MIFSGFIRRAALAALIVVAPLLAEARDLRLQLDPNSEAFNIGGWSRRVAETGTIFYSCVEDFCGRGSLVSIRKQTSAPATLEALRRNEQQISDTMIQRAQGRIARIDLGEPAMITDNVFRVGEITRTIVPAGGGAIQGLDLYWKTGFVAAPSLIYSIGSSANSRELANDNYDAFKLGLMMIGARRN